MQNQAIVFALPANGSVTIGRQDPVTGISPDIDLTSVDPERSSSRRHAKMYREGQMYLLVEDIGATNGTFLNRQADSYRRSSRGEIRAIKFASASWSSPSRATERGLDLRF